MTKECTDGEWPCEMSTHVAGVETENSFLKDFLKQLLSMFDDREAYVINGPRYIAQAINQIKLTLEEYPDFAKVKPAGEKPNKALEFIEEWGGIDGGHHKQWTLDQLVRILSDDYEKWVIDYQEGEDGPETYEWDEGIAP